MEKLKVEFTNEPLTGASLKIKVKKTAWWYICLLLGLTGFAKKAIKLAETKPLVVFGKIR